MIRSGLLRSVWLYRMVRWLLAGIFIWAGIVKLSDPQAFAVVIRDFGIVPNGWALPISFGLPALELLAAIGLIFDMRGSLGGMTFLLLLFIAVISYALWMGFDIDCGCFGPEEPESRAYNGLRTALYRDIAMGAGIFFCIGGVFRMMPVSRPVGRG